MSGLLYLIPAALLLGAIGLLAFLWALRRNQFDDLDGAQHRILFDDEGDRPGLAARPADPERAEPEVASRHDSGAR
jgi:cbb3-type cytochrome oxidase maturation protein